MAPTESYQVESVENETEIKAFFGVKSFQLCLSCVSKATVARRPVSMATFYSSNLAVVVKLCSKPEDRACAMATLQVDGCNCVLHCATQWWCDSLERENETVICRFIGLTFDGWQSKAL